MAIAKYWSPFAFLALVPLGWRLGGAWTFLLLGVLPLALAGGDWLIGEEPPAASEDHPLAHRLLPWLYAPLQLAEIVWAGWEVSRPSTDLVTAIGLTLSTGLAAGVFGFLAAHELIHSRHRPERIYGLVLLASLLDMQFAISHVQGHHRRPATFEDAASARRGESLYAFWMRSVSGQAREAWTFETGRLARAGRMPIGPGNRLLLWFAIEALIVAAIAAYSWRALAFFLAQAVLAILLLESFNYVAHYGLIRRRRPDGRLEPLSPKHSWNSVRRMNNASLFNMGRHADHHRFSARPYNELEVLDGGARLPCGYAGVILMALIPPLWRRVMDPRVDAALDDPQAIGRPERAAA
ncbi:MAG TPA: alkane 1-monooxygenase [Caulobacteraceae bacterium]|jgi:alkane 1-monooxygenase|nr:alkane 1-monooxygenase [Caulobacteraceae bacterium]